MSETWKCPGCGECVEDHYVECWNCQTPRPGYTTPAEQARRYEEQQAEYERQNVVGNQIQEEILRQNKLSDEILTEQIRQERLSAELLDLERSNQNRLAALLDRWENLTASIESLKRQE